jgi:hypothetical protein
LEKQKKIYRLMKPKIFPWAATRIGYFFLKGMGVGRKRGMERGKDGRQGGRKARRK